MAGSVNKTILVGRLGKDPEVRATQAGGKIVNITLATSETWNDKQSGERKEKTEWHRVVIFNDRLADVAEKYLKKGSSVYVEGSLQTRKWTDNAGVERFSATEVVLAAFRGELTMLGSPPDREQSQANGSYSPRAETRPARPASRPSQPAAAPSWDAPGGGELDDQIPFGPEMR